MISEFKVQGYWRVGIHQHLVDFRLYPNLSFDSSSHSCQIGSLTIFVF